MSVEPVSLAAHAYVGNSNNTKMVSTDPPQYYPSANSGCSDAELVSAAMACLPDGRSDSTSVASEACSSMPQSMLSGFGQSAPLSARSFGNYSCGNTSSGHGGAPSRHPPSHPHAQCLQQPPPYFNRECLRSSPPPLLRALHTYAPPPPPPPQRRHAGFPSGLGGADGSGAALGPQPPCGRTRPSALEDDSDPWLQCMVTGIEGEEEGEGTVVAAAAVLTGPGMAAAAAPATSEAGKDIGMGPFAGCLSGVATPLIESSPRDTIAAAAVAGADMGMGLAAGNISSSSVVGTDWLDYEGGIPRDDSAREGGNGCESPAAEAAAEASSPAMFGYCLGGGRGGGGGRPQRRACNRGFVCPGPVVSTAIVDAASNAALTGGAGRGGGAAAGAGGAVVPLAAATIAGSWSEGRVPWTVRRGAVQWHGGPRGGIPARMIAVGCGGWYGGRNAAAAIAADDDDDDDLAIMAGHRCGGSGAATRLRRLFAYDTCSAGGGGGSSTWGLMPAAANAAVGFRDASRQMVPLRKAASAAAMTHQWKGADAAAATAAGDQHRRVSLADSDDWDSLWPEEYMADPEPLPYGRQRPRQQSQLQQQQQLAMGTLSLTMTGGPLLDLPDGWEEAMMALGDTPTRGSLPPGPQLLEAAEWPGRPCDDGGAAGAVAGGGGSRGGGAWQRKLRAGLGGLLKSFTRCYT